MFRKNDDLPDVLRIMSKRAVQRLHYSVGSSHGHRAQNVVWFERFKSAEDDRPSIFPPAHYFRAPGVSSQRKLAVESARVFSPSLVRKSLKRERIFPGSVLDQNRN